MIRVTARRVFMKVGKAVVKLHLSCASILNAHCQRMSNFGFADHKEDYEEDPFGALSRQFARCQFLVLPEMPVR